MQQNPNLKNHRQKRENEIWEIKINKRRDKEMMKELDEKKTIGQEGISGSILKECRQEMRYSNHYLIECSLKTGKVTKNW